MACATIFPSNTVISMRLPDSASTFTAEVWAIIKALEQIKDYIASKYIVFTDSHLCLQALHRMKLEHPLIGMVIRKCVFFYFAKIDIILCWVSHHIGIRGVPYNDFKHCISQYILSTWQDNWNGAVVNKLHSVKPVLGKLAVLLQLHGKDEVVLCCAHIGHIHLTHSYILRKDPQPQFGGVQSF